MHEKIFRKENKVMGVARIFFGGGNTFKKFQKSLKSLYSFLKISHDRSMLFCIKVSICEPLSIRYAQKSLIQFGKIAKPWKKLPNFYRFFKEFWETEVFPMDDALDYHFTLNAFKISWK